MTDVNQRFRGEPELSGQGHQPVQRFLLQPLFPGQNPQIRTVRTADQGVPVMLPVEGDNDVGAVKGTE